MHPKTTALRLDRRKATDHTQARVHKDLLCLFSTHYRTTLQEVDLGIFDNSLSLNLDSMACHMLFGWLYTGRLPPFAKWKSLFSLYVFAEQTDMLALRRTVMTEVVRDTPPVPPLEQAAIVLNLLPSTAPLYGWLLDQFTHHVVLQHDTPTSLLPNEFLVDWVKRALVRTCSVGEKVCVQCPCCRKNPCAYHEHEGLQEWESSKSTKNWQSIDSNT